MSPKKTALYPVHEKLGAAFTDFGGWDMPLKYANDVAEHQAVRTRAGIFDLSHMGEFRITGPMPLHSSTTLWSPTCPYSSLVAPSTRFSPTTRAA